MAVHIAPAAIFAVMLPWAMYRRVRRNIGRQAYSPLRLKLRTVFILAVLALIAGPTLIEGTMAPLAAFALGAAAGIGIGIFALKHTKFEQVEDQRYYIPNRYIGLVLSAALLARMGWRTWQMWPTLSQGDAMTMPSFSGMTPVTLGMVAAVLLYYVAYYVGILRVEEQMALKTTT